MTGSNGTSLANSNASHLLDGRSPSLILTHPTDEEKRRQLIANGSSWRGVLSEEAYLRRELHLASQGATRDGGMTYWVLVDGPDPETRHVLSGCETYRKKALVAKGGVVEMSVVHGIGSVFCPVEFRGRGYAGRMMELLGEKLRYWQSNNGCPFSILFSDIGKKFYTARGWKPFPSTHVSLPPWRGPERRHGGGDYPLPTARPLYSSDLPELCALDEKLIAQSLQQAALHTKNTMVALLPDVQTIQWHHAREDFINLEFLGRTPEIKGAVVGPVGKRVWCYWTRMYGDKDEGNTFHILRLVAEDKGIVNWETERMNTVDQGTYRTYIAALVVLAQQEAAKWDMEHVEIWNPTPVIIETARWIAGDAALLVDRQKDSIASLNWYGKSDGHVSGDVVWIGNEKYGWC